MNAITASNLFLEKSYQTILEDYMDSLNSPFAPSWDWVFITASNETQAKSYRLQINERLESNFLNKRTKYVVLPDPDGKRVGSGGATLNVLKHIRENTVDIDNIFNTKILVIHSGGDSQRIPQYSVCGKLFSPVPRVLPDGRRSMLFDEIMISLSALPGRMNHGMFTISGDVLMLFNPYQVDLKLKKSAAAISIKSSVDVGVNHGVFLTDEKNRVVKFLHKQSRDELINNGAVDENKNIDIDTGAVWFSSDILKALFSLISRNNAVDLQKYKALVNDDVRLSYYGDFLFPLAYDASYEDYLKSAREGKRGDKLLKIRRLVWSVLNQFDMSVIKMSPAKFIHFGTTRELHRLVNNAEDKYSHLGWSKNVLTNISTDRYAISNSYVDPNAIIDDNCYIEDCYIGANVKIGENAILSNLSVDNFVIPGNIVMHGLKLNNNKHCVRVYDIDANPKENNLWSSKIYPVCDTAEEALKAALSNRPGSYKTLISLEESFKKADISKTLKWKNHLEGIIRVERFAEALSNRVDIKTAINILGIKWFSQIPRLFDKAESSDYPLKFRIYLAISYILKKNNTAYEGLSYLHFEELCYKTLKEKIEHYHRYNGISNNEISFIKDTVTVELPARVNWGGGWSDTVPYSTENNATVLNAAIKINGKFPVCVTIKKTSDKTVKFKSIDLEEEATFTSKKSLLDLSDPSDPFLIHKCALMIAGIITDDKPLDSLLRRIGGGIEIISHVALPKGSGLGTSSIFASACLKAVYDIFEIKYDEQSLYSDVLLLEQLIGTGGGWQDQVGALTPGIKLNSSAPATLAVPGMVQEINVEYVSVPSEAYKELKDRFVLVFSGQQRFARNILREIMNKYILSDTQTLRILEEIQKLAKSMKKALEDGDIQKFSELLSAHYELSKRLDKGSSNNSIDLIFELCDDLIDGRFICGAGGGGFLQMILKKGISKDQLQERLNTLFRGSGVEVWDCEILL